MEIQDIKEAVKFLDEHCPGDLNLKCKERCIDYDEYLTCWKEALENKED